MRILHCYCLNYNIGDYALGIGVKNLLRQYLNVDLIGNTNIQGREFDMYYIKEVVNKKFDLLVLGGGGIIHGAHWPNGWFWLIKKELIKEIKIPFIIYGVGNNYWEGEGDIPKRGIEHLKETFNRSAYFSVRNDGSRDRLLSMTGIKAPAIPDPGFHVNLNTTYPRAINSPYVIIQLANDKPIYRFGSLEKREIFIKHMKAVTINLSKKYKVIFIPHVYDDIIISRMICEGIPNVNVLDFGQYAFDHSDRVIGMYKYAEFVIAMRGHGQIIPIAFNTPVIAIENHPKHRGLMESLDLSDYIVNLTDISFAHCLNKKIEEIENNKTMLTERYRNINERLNRDSQKAFRNIKDKINK